MTVTDAQHEASRTKSLGELGELFCLKALVDFKFDSIRNLNDDKMNYPFADLLAEKDGKKYVISVKTRNKYKKSGKVNSHYNVLDKKNSYEHAKKAEEKHNAEAYWMAAQFDNSTYSIYFGALSELNGSKSISISKCENNEMGQCLVPNKSHNFNFNFFTNLPS